MVALCILGPVAVVAGWAHLDGVPPEDDDAGNRAAFAGLSFVLLGMGQVPTLLAYFVARAFRWGRPAALAAAAFVSVVVPGALLALMSAA